MEMISIIYVGYASLCAVRSDMEVKLLLLTCSVRWHGDLHLNDGHSILQRNFMRGKYNSKVAVW